jgi:hypothetical protein
MHRFAVVLLVLAIGFLARGATSPPALAAVSSEAAEFFEKKIRPVLADHCFQCHGPEKQKSGLRLDSRVAVLKGNDAGPVVAPGEPDKSRLVQAIRYNGEIKMPPKAKLPPEAIAALTEWVRQGAPWPETAKPGVRSLEELGKKHWAFQPVKKPPVPPTKNAAWMKSPVDAFILAKLEAQGMTPAPPADRATLLRRVTFDLIGLPPTPDEIDSFINDPAQDALANVVDRLLASPRYGERWGRFWLDVARYADSKGYVFTEERRYPFAYTYRDYVIRAFNQDLPYDRFLIEQIAADQLPLGDDKTPLAAMGFLTLGRRFLNNVHDIIDDRIDVVMRGTLGLTVACARCHDHKFDPIPTSDYYSLHGVFASSTEPKDLPALGTPVADDAKEAYEKELRQFEAAVAEFQEKHKEELQARNQQVQGQFNAIKGKIDKLNATHPGAPARGMVLIDGANPHNSHVLLRGNPGNLGLEVPRQFPAVLTGEKRKPFTHGSGRLELAEAIASKENPLTARVIVNRVWLYHFGAGLVRTPSNFGLQGAPPSHPELLDYLAWQLMEEGWSLKKLHRLILLSAAYQQSSDANDQFRERDPDNFYLSHMNRRRLDYESLRDSLLAVTGDIDFKMGGPSIDEFKEPFARRRSVYGYVDRQNLPGVLRVFDFASPDTHSPQRFTTTVPQQALFLMNSPFVVEQVKRLTARPDVQAEADPAKRIQILYRLLYGRPADEEETALGLRFLAAPQEENGHLSVWEKYVQVLLMTNNFGFVD